MHIDSSITEFPKKNDVISDQAVTHWKHLERLQNLGKYLSLSKRRSFVSRILQNLTENTFPVIERRHKKT